MEYSGYEPISLERPTPEDEELSEKLKEKVRSMGGFNSKETADRKSAVLKKIQQLAKRFVEEIPQSEVSGNFHLKAVTSGLHKLGIPTTKPDIDVLFVGSRPVTRKNFFGDFYKMLQHENNVKECTAAPNAFVPVIRATVDNVEVDIVFAELRSKATIPDTFELRDDNILEGLDKYSVRSLNWWRANEEILHLVPDVENFRHTLRAIIIWAKRRQIYSSSLGFLGGVSYAILVAKICQLYPLALPSTLVKAFFEVFSQWEWSYECPVRLKPSVENRALGELAWDFIRNPKDLMQIVYPIHPHGNSSFNVNMSSLKILKKEFKSGYKVVSEIHNNEACWSKLFEEVNFFEEFQHFVVVTARAADDRRFRRWIGMVQSKIRILVGFLDSCEDISSIRVNTEHFSPGSETDNFVRRWFLGFVIRRRLRLNDLKSHFKNFRSNTVGAAKHFSFYQEDMELEAVYADRKQVEEMEKEQSQFEIPILPNTSAYCADLQPSASSSAETTSQCDGGAPAKVRKTE